MTHDTNIIITAYVVGCNYRRIDNAAYKSSMEGLCDVRCNNSHTVHFDYQLFLWEFFSIIGRCETKSQLNKEVILNVTVKRNKTSHQTVGAVI